MVIITSRYTKPLEVIDSLLAEHRAFLAEHYRQSKFIVSGPQNPRVGGAILATVGIDEAREIMKKDPFTVHGAAEYSFIEFTPGSHDPRFACFLK
ncbi:MAG: YCII-related domain protein [Syntrophaceae bacterium PtaB.Bin038]|nr:MAG: YCII-related domain protein [Syntrophaceae bacterium PtaB.Bin038]